MLLFSRLIISNIQIMIFTFFYILPLRIIFKQSLQMFPFADEFAFFCILKLAKIIFLVLQIKHYIIFLK